MQKKSKVLKKKSYVCAGPTRGVSGGTLYPDPSLEGPGTQGARKSSGCRVKFLLLTIFWANLSEDIFLLFTWFWGKIRTKFEWRPFFLLFALKKFCASLVRRQKIKYGMGPNKAWGPNKIWGPGIDLRTPWKNFSLRSCVCVNRIEEHYLFLSALPSLSTDNADRNDEFARY